MKAFKPSFLFHSVFNGIAFTYDLSRFSRTPNFSTSLHLFKRGRNSSLILDSGQKAELTFPNKIDSQILKVEEAQRQETHSNSAEFLSLRWMDAVQCSLSWRDQGSIWLSNMKESRLLKGTFPLLILLLLLRMNWNFHTTTQQLRTFQFRNADVAKKNYCEL